jgi:hypothetical protein
MRTSDPAVKSVLQQALVFAAEMMSAAARRHTRHAGYLAGRMWRIYRPAYLPLYMLAAAVGVAVVLLVMTAWLRIMIPTYILARGETG